MILPILKYPNGTLKKRSNALTIEGSRLPDLQQVQALVVNMFDTMRSARGLGLAAVQVGVLRRVLVIEAADGNSPLAMVNPSIVETLGVQEEKNEGCLSFPGIFEKVPRWTEVRVSYYSLSQGRHVEAHLKGMQAHAVQHEIEHLDGILLSEHMTRARRGQVLGELRAQRHFR